MFQPVFHCILKQRRQAHKLRQLDLGRQCHIPWKKIGLFEQGRRVPSEDELRRLEAVLGSFDTCVFRPARYLETLRNLSARRRASHLPYFPPWDRPAAVRFHAARKQHPDLVRSLESCTRGRPDFALVNYFTAQLSCGSAVECLYLLSLLARGGQPALAPPLGFRRLPHPVVDPITREWVCHRPFPAIVLGEAHHFFQVSMLTPRLYTVDVLRWDGAWTVVEIDGRGHDGRGDQERDQAIGLPVKRLSGNDVIEIARDALR